MRNQVVAVLTARYILILIFVSPAAKVSNSEAILPNIMREPTIDTKPHRHLIRGKCTNMKQKTIVYTMERRETGKAFGYSTNVIKLTKCLTIIT